MFVKDEGHVEAALTVGGALVSGKKDGEMGWSVVLEDWGYADGGVAVKSLAGKWLWV